MSKINQQQASKLRKTQPYWEGIFNNKARRLPPKMTFNTMVQDWVRESCHGLWSSEVGSDQNVHVTFFDKSDFETMVRSFTPNRRRDGGALGSRGAFEYPT